MTNPDLEALLDHIKSSKFTEARLIELIDDRRIPVATLAIRNLVERWGDEPRIVREVVRRVGSVGWQHKLAGTVSIAHWALGCMLDCGHTAARVAANNAIRDWPETDREDLEWYLNSRGAESGSEIGDGS
jgi:hypothetical protein